MFDPRLKLRYIRDNGEKRNILALMDILDHDFGLNYNISKEGHVIEIQIVGANLVSIPRILARFPHLIKLRLQSNQIYRLRNIERCINLEYLDLSDNRLNDSELEYIGNLKNLRYLDLSYNSLKSPYPLNSDNLSSLEVLIMHHNNIAEIPRLEKLTNLRILNLSNNPIKRLINIDALKSLTKLMLDNTDLDEKERTIMAMPPEKIKEYCRGAEKSPN